MRRKWYLSIFTSFYNLLSSIWLRAIVQLKDLYPYEEYLPKVKNTNKKDFALALYEIKKTPYYSIEELQAARQMSLQEVAESSGSDSDFVVNRETASASSSEVESCSSACGETKKKKTAASSSTKKNKNARKNKSKNISRSGGKRKTSSDEDEEMKEEMASDQEEQQIEPIPRTKKARRAISTNNDSNDKNAKEEGEEDRPAPIKTTEEQTIEENSNYSNSMDSHTSSAGAPKVVKLDESSISDQGVLRLIDKVPNDILARKLVEKEQEKELRKKMKKEEKRRKKEEKRAKKLLRAEQNGQQMETGEASSVNNSNQSEVAKRLTAINTHIQTSVSKNQTNLEQFLATMESINSVEFASEPHINYKDELKQLVHLIKKCRRFNNTQVKEIASEYYEKLRRLFQADPNVSCRWIVPISWN